MWDGVDRREFPRVKYPCLITVRKETPPSFSILTHTENISVGGVRVIIKKKIEIMTEVEVEIDLMDTFTNVTSKGTIAWVKKVSAGQKGQPKANDKQIYLLKGTIAWVKEIPATRKGQPLRYDTGIRFIVLRNKDRERIQKIVNHLLGESK